MDANERCRDIRAHTADCDAEHYIRAHGMECGPSRCCANVGRLNIPHGTDSMGAFSNRAIIKGQGMAKKHKNMCPESRRKHDGALRYKRLKKKRKALQRNKRIDN